MPRLSFEETYCKTALNRVQARGMSFNWSLNPYRSCAHACVYCYAREYHTYLERDGTRDFEQRIIVKLNVAHVLREELAAPSWKRELVAVGTATDPYQPAEGKYRLTRACLEIFLAQLTPVSLATKSTMVLRDRALLVDLAQAAGASVMFSITTLDRELVRKIEPDTPPPQQRLRVMEELARAGVRVGVALAPVLPGLTDGEGNIEAVARAARDHGASFFFAGTLRLTPVPRQTYFDFLARERPELTARTARLYEEGPYALRSYQQAVERRVERLKAKVGLAERPAPNRRVVHRERQLSLGL